MKQSSWRNIGSDVTGKTMSEVLKQSGLDYTVVKEPVFAKSAFANKATKVPGAFVTRVQGENQFFGTVGSKYEVVQNIDAFDFIDNLVMDGLVYEKAGQTQNGLIYIIASLPEYKLFDDGMKPYVIFQNSHNGSTPVKAAITTLRLVCENQFNIAFKKSLNTVVLRHTRNVKDKLAEAERVLQHVSGYSEQFAAFAEELKNTKMPVAKAKKVAAQLFPYKEEDSELKQRRAQEAQDSLLGIYKGDEDLQNFRGTGWGLMNAYTDYITHSEPSRKSENWEEGKFLSLLWRPMDSVAEIIKSVA